MNFQLYLQNNKAPHDVRGDFIRLALSDPEFPDIKTWDELRSYVLDRHNNHQIVDGASLVWKAFEAGERKAAAGLQRYLDAGGEETS